MRASLVAFSLLAGGAVACEAPEEEAAITVKPGEGAASGRAGSAGTAGTVGTAGVGGGGGKQISAGNGGGAGGPGAGSAGASGQAGEGGQAGESAKGGAGGAASPPPPPDIGTVAWTSIGVGVTFKEAPGQPGGAAFLGYAGFNIAQPWAEAWVDELYRTSLKDLGVRWLYAIKGPQDSAYAAKEIGNSKLCASLGEHLDGGTAPVIVAAHSSGSFVAHELFSQLVDKQLDGGKSAGRLVYFNLDGGQSGLAGNAVQAMRRAYFVWSRDGGTLSPNAGTMQSLGATYGSKGGGRENDANGSGCNQGAPWCVHITLVNQRPHGSVSGSPQADYSSFDAEHPVSTAYLKTTQSEWL